MDSDTSPDLVKTDNRLGIFFKICATLAFTIMSACIRAVGDSVPAGQTMFARSFLALIPLLAVLVWRKELILAIRVQRLTDHLRRSSLGAVGVFLMIVSLKFLPLADVTAIGFMTPLFTLVLAAVLLGDQLRRNRLLAVILGFSGVIVMLWPHLGFVKSASQKQFYLGLVCALGWSMISAMVVILVRKISRTETTWSIVFYFCVICSAASLISLPWGWVWPDARQTALLAGAGLSGGIAQLFMTQSYRLALPSVVAPFDYMSMLWAIALGWMFFSEIPTLYALCGACLVIIAGAGVLMRDHLTEKAGLS